MDLSRLLARILGPTLAVLAITEAVNLPLLAANAPGVIYLNGTLLFLSGVAIVQAHNRWVWAWPLALTLSGWTMLAAGLYRMIAPAGPQAGGTPGTYAILAVIAIVGATMSWQGYLRR
jgi:hypothetical protein